MDFAIIETGGKQYKITPNSTFNIEKLTGNAGDKLVFDKVLMVVDGDDVQIGDPYLKDVSFEAVLEEQTKGKKIRILRFKAKSRHRRRQGHRQQLTTINFAAKKTVAKAAPKAEAKVDAKTPEKKAAKPAVKAVAKKPTVKKTAK